MAEGLKDTNRGVLIAVEGIDGAGKTTQVRMLRLALEAAGAEVVCTKEPTDGEHGRRIKASAQNGRMHLSWELKAFIRDRQEHVRETIQPALSEGRVVILDRYFYSTIAYQGARLDDWTNGALIRLEGIVNRSPPLPDAVFVLDIDPELGLKRISEFRGETPNRFERAESLTVSRAIFNRMCEVEPKLLWKIDGSRTAEEVHQTILSVLIRTALRTKKCAKSYGCRDPSHCAPRLAGTCEWWNLKERLSMPLKTPFPALLAPEPEFAFLEENAQS